MNPAIIPPSGTSFWQSINQLVTSNPITIDRPKATAYPCFPEMIYLPDYGYLENTSASDGAGIDVWFGSLRDKTLTGILCTFDTLKLDAEIKILIGCAHEDIEIIRNFHGNLQSLFIPNPMVANDLSNPVS